LIAWLSLLVAFSKSLFSSRCRALRLEEKACRQPGSSLGIIWINDDNDNGDVTKPDYSTGVVNGQNDLKDFFPLALMINSLVSALPPGQYSYVLKQADGALNFTYSTLTANSAYGYLTSQTSTGYGAGLSQPAASATVTQITAAGVTLDSAFLKQIQGQGGVILVEGRTPSVQPLVLSVEQNGVEVAELSLPLSLSARILLLLHGMNSDTSTWDTFVNSAFSGSSTVVFQGNTQVPNALPPAISSTGVRCYRLQFGAYDDDSSARTGLEGWTVNSTDPVSPIRQVPCGDYEDFGHLGQEIDDAISFLLTNPQFKNAQIVLLGHSRGGIAARSFLQGSSANKSNVIGLLTTGSPQEGSPLGTIYQWLTANPRHVFDSNGNELTVPVIVPGSDVPVTEPVNWQDWSVVDWLRSADAVLGTFGSKPPLDVRRPVIGELANSSTDISGLNATSVVSNLPINSITYGEIVYDEVPLGILQLQGPGILAGVTDPQYSVFEGILSPLIVSPLTDPARTFILGTNASGTANTVTTWRGDGLVPASYQLFTTLPGFSGTRVNPLANVGGIVVHTDEPKQTTDLLTQLKKVVPTWLP
jgi:PGAP1-like protein